MLAGVKLVNPDDAQMNNIHLDGNIGVIEKLLEKQYSDFPQNGQVRILTFFIIIFLLIYFICLSIQASVLMLVVIFSHCMRV